MRLHLIPLLLLAMSLVFACGESRPKYTMQQVMFEIDAATNELALKMDSADQLPKALALAREIERWMADPSIEYRMEQGGLPGDMNEMRELHGRFDALLADVIRAAESGNLEGFRASYAPMRMSCEVCHLKFRPAITNGVGTGSMGR